MAAHMLGEIVGNYEVTKKIGAGGMGAVYLAKHTLIGRQAAIKVLLPELSHKQEIVNRFFNEAKSATAIKHPGIVEIYDFGYAEDGSAYIVMEFLDGESLDMRIRKLGRLPALFAVDITRQVASGLSAAHEQSIIHRDLKPDNIFLVPDPVSRGERTKILDFGIAKLVAEGPASMTRTGTILGTPAYMSPEQCRGAGHVDHRADLYSQGCILYQMLCGCLPFEGEGAGEILAAHIHVQPRPAREIEPTLAPELEALVMRLLAKNPDDRFATAADLMAALEALPFHMFGEPAGTDPALIGVPAMGTPFPYVTPTPVPPTGASAPDTGPGTALGVPPSAPGTGPGAVPQPTPSSPAGSGPVAMAAVAADIQSQPGTGPVAAAWAPGTGPGTAPPSAPGTGPGIVLGVPGTGPNLLTPALAPATGPGIGADEATVHGYAADNGNVPTTLSAAAGPMATQAPTSSPKLWLPLALIGAVVVGGIVFVVASPGDGDEDKVAAAEPAQGEEVPTPPVAEPEAQPEVVVKPPEPEVAAPIPQITIALESDPAGAQVYRQPQGVRVGITPMKLVIDPLRGELVFILKKSGFVDKTVVTTADQDRRVSVELVKKHRRPRPVAKPKGDRTVNPFEKK